VRVSGQVVVPAGATVRGTITAISEKPASMTMQFDDIELSGGTRKLDAKPTVVSLVPHSQMKDKGAKIGGGAAAGAVIGGVVSGNVKGAVIGAAAGAAAGTGVAMATKQHYATLASGARVTVQLRSSLAVPLAPEQDRSGR
jgi:hypothetical protein